MNKWLALLSQTSQNSTPYNAINLQPKTNNQYVNSQSLMLDFKESKTVESIPAIEKSDNRDLLLKILIIGLLTFFGLDYAWLKFQAGVEDSPTRRNSNEQREF